MSTTVTTRRAAAKAAKVGTPRRKPAPNLTPLADEGIVVAIVAVTGTDDHVGDVIAPGAFTKTLKARRPKVCFNHSWADPLGRVLHIVELMPGDARLPKVLPDGRPWPREAGAVIATMQYHMSTERGREMFAHTKEWAAAGEAAFSIGYKAVPGRTSKRADGVRVIYELMLFEVSLVLHGAHDMALALEVKSGKPTPFIVNDPAATNWVEEAGGLPPYIREVANALVREHGFSQEHAIATAVNRMKRWAAGKDNVKADTIARASATLVQWEAMKASTEGKALDLETRTAPTGLTTVVESDTQPDFSGSAMLALYPDPEAAAEIAVAGGTPTDELHVTVAFLGDAADLDGEALVGALTPALAGTGPLAGSVGGLGMFPAGDDGVPVWVPVDVPGLDALRTAAVTALEAAGFPQQSEHGFTPHMTLGYDLDAVDPVDPVPVSFTEAALVIGGERLPIPLTAPTAPPMEGKAASAVRAARAEWVMSNLEFKTAAMVVTEAKSLNPTLEVKTMQNALAGSFEELNRKLRDAVHALFAPPKRAEGEGPGPSQPCPDAWVEATFPDQVVVNVTDYDKPADQRETTYTIPYTVTADGAVELGTPEEARIEVTLANAEPDTDGDLPVVSDPVEAAMARFTLPLESMLADATHLAMLAPEGKGLEEIIRPALDALLDTLAAKGLPYSPDPIDTDEDDDEWGVLAAELDADLDGADTSEGEDDMFDDPDDEPAPDDLDDVLEVDPDAPADDEDEDMDGDVVKLDPSEVDADMADLSMDPLEDDEPLP